MPSFQLPVRFIQPGRSSHGMFSQMLQQQLCRTVGLHLKGKVTCAFENLEPVRSFYVVGIGLGRLPCDISCARRPDKQCRHGHRFQRHSFTGGDNLRTRDVGSVPMENGAKDIVVIERFNVEIGLLLSSQRNDLQARASISYGVCPGRRLAYPDGSA